VASGPLWIPACVGVGSNLGSPAAQVRQGLAKLESLDDTRLLAASRLYRNPPMGPVDQPDYVNAAAVILTRQTPRDLLDRCKAIEREQGRGPGEDLRWGPRQLDLDILTYGSWEIDEPGLKIPHPGISERNFVLFPLLEIAPQLRIPGLGVVWRLALKVDASTLQEIR
jgi:2-amino-4-hydroxy-6-hydroxymethyldihydropteridine diphosphokinase